MAYCKIKSVKNNLKRVIDYVANKDKTDEDVYLELHKELNYVANNSIMRHSNNIKIIYIYGPTWPGLGQFGPGQAEANVGQV